MFERFGTNTRATIKAKEKRRIRQSTNSHRTSGSQRNIVSSYIADFKHDRLQEVLKKKLIDQYGIGAVKKEENYVDIKLERPTSVTFL